VRVEAILLIIVGAFFAVTATVYYIWGTAVSQNEVGGIVMLIGTVLLGFVPGSYYLWWSHRMKPRPEDRPDGTLAEGAGVIGAFPNSSIWPFVFGMGVFLIVLSFVFGLWLMAPGFALVISAAVGVTAESRRGGAV
jgi:Cytochrome c oxidase subunit IV